MTLLNIVILESHFHVKPIFLAATSSSRSGLVTQFVRLSVVIFELVSKWLLDDVMKRLRGFARQFCLSILPVNFARQFCL